MRIAVAGKGGAGKTTLSATLARLMARHGLSVVAIDADSNPNLAAALGLDPDDESRVASLPAGLVSRRLDGPALTEPVDRTLDTYAARGPDGVRVTRMGMPAHAEEGCMCAGHATVRALLGDLGDRPDTVTIVDMEATPEHLSRGTARNVDLLLLVTEAYYRSLETVRRMATLAGELPITRVAVLANKVGSEQESEAIAAFCQRHGLELLAEVPWSEAVRAADVARVPLVDHAPEDVVVTTLRKLAPRLVATGQPTG